MEPEVHSSTEEERLREAIREFEEAEQRKDLEAMMEFYAEDAVFQETGIPELQGREAIKGFFAPFLPKMISHKDIVRDVVVSDSGDLAYTTGSSWTLLAKEGSEGGIESDYQWLLVWRKISGEWKCVAHSGNYLKAIQ